MGEPEDHVPDPERRSFVSRVSGVAMAGGLLTGYGAFVHVAGRFLYPAREPDTRWLFVTREVDLRPGSALAFRSPGGARITIARRSVEDGGEFVALSSICPHLGCQVHWEAGNRRFFCPCHNGAFDADGKATAGPPADAGQRLSSYPLEIRDGLVFIGLREDVSEADPPDRLVEDPADGPPGPGHDPCLFDRPGDERAV